MSLKTNIVSGLAALIYAWSVMLGAQGFSAAQVYDVVVANQ
jgi:phosphoribosyl-ATP pyrophosphohydrolase